jgi:hypothetical protein
MWDGDMIRRGAIICLTLGAMLTLGSCVANCCYPRAIILRSSPSDFSLPVWSSASIAWCCLILARIDAVDASPREDESEFRAFGVRSRVWSTFKINDRTGRLRTLSNVRYTLITIPLPLLFVALAAYPMVAFIRGPLRRWRRRDTGLCRRCGYNLTANVSGRCPECGAPVTTPPGESGAV